MQEKEIANLIAKDDSRLANIRSQIFSGNPNLLNTYLSALNQLLDNPIDHQKAYAEINQLCSSAQPSIIIELNNQIFPKVAKKHTRRDLDKYIIYWRKTFHGSGARLNYPNVANTLAEVSVHNNQSDIFSDFSRASREFQKNMVLLQQKKIQFFQDMEGDSFLSDSMDGDTLLDIIEMDVQEIKEIRKIVQSGPIDEIQAEEYYKKMKNFLAIRPKTLSRELNEDFNNQKIWAKEYIECYRQYNIDGGNLNLYKQLGNGKRLIATSEEPQNPNYEGQSVGNISFKSKQEQFLNFDDSLKKNFNQKRKMHGEQRMTYDSKKQPKSPPQTAKFLPAQNIQSSHQILHIEPQQMQISEAYHSPKGLKGAKNQNMHSGNLKVNNDQQRDIKINDEKYPMSQSQYQDLQKSKGGYMTSKPLSDPHFILDPSEIRKQSPINRYTHEVSMSQSRNSRRSKIFAKKEKKMIEQQPGEEDLVVIKHRATADPKVNFHQQNQNPYFQPMMRHTLSSQYQNSTHSPKINEQFTPINNKTSRAALSPNTAFPSRTLYGGTSSKKLSQFTQEKRQRRMVAPVEELSPIEDYVLKPYSQNFDEVHNFARFRRNCLEDNFTLYASAFLLVSCVVLRESDSKVKIQILFQNQSHSNLIVQSVYRVPKCFKIQKYSKINKRFTLYDQVQHVFALQLVSFPLEACIMNLKYTLQMNGSDIRSQSATPIVIPLTMRNFLEYLILGEEQWRKCWARWSQNRNFSITRHILLDRLVASDTTIESVLKQFTNIPGIEGYSVQQFGAFCRHQSIGDLKFLLRISLRVDNIMSLQILTDRKVKDQDQADFLQYCVNVWSMLLSKIMDSSMV